MFQVSGKELTDIHKDLSICTFPWLLSYVLSFARILTYRPLISNFTYLALAISQLEVSDKQTDAHESQTHECSHSEHMSVAVWDTDGQRSVNRDQRPIMNDQCPVFCIPNVSDPSAPKPIPSDSLAVSSLHPVMQRTDVMFSV